MRASFKGLTNGVFNCAADFLLWQIGLFGASFGKSSSSGGVYKTFYEADKFLQELNHETIRGAWKKLKRKGLIEIIKEEGFYKPVITQSAINRLKTIIPQYQAHRPWDKKIYIITYDIPEKQARTRSLLRETIRRLGGAMLQLSVWICPYNIKYILDKLMEEREIKGTVIVSDTGKDGAIGERSIEELIIDIYQLEALNERYTEFLWMLDKGKKSRQELLTNYLSIFKDDPQLPFELLPHWWVGDIAYRKYKKLLSSGKVV